jgi:amidohydrolase
MTQPTSDLASAAQAVTPDVIELRREIHANPELGLHLPETQKRILDSLTGLGLDITLGENLTSVVADVDTGRAGPTVLLRGDMDALPLNEDTDESFTSTVEGRMHACGHDSHVAMLAGAAKLLSEYRGELRGRIRFMFQPGEEGYHGARYMIEEGLLDGVDRAFAIHVDTNQPSGSILCRGGPMFASSDELHVEVTGKGGHAAAPQFARDPITAAAAMVGAFHTMVTREVAAFDPAVVTIAHINGGSTNNIIPESATMEGTIRAFTEDTRNLVHDSIVRVAAGVAETHGCSCKVNIVKGYPVTVNDATMVGLVQQMTEATLGTGSYVSAQNPDMAAEDFAYVLQKVPGAIMSLGACPNGIDNAAHAPALHSNRMVLNEDVLHRGVAMYAAMAIAPALDG